MKKETVPVRNSLLLLLTATIWGIAFVAQSVSMDYIGGFTFQFNPKPYWFTDAFAGHPAYSASQNLPEEKKQYPQTSSNQQDH